MYRLISFIVIFVFVSTLLYYHNQSDHSNMPAHSMAHGSVEIPADEKVPVLQGELRQDDMGSWMLKLDIVNFQFTPEKLGQPSSSLHEGHAHLYINGEKIGRIYSPYTDLGQLEKGTHLIRAALYTNDHQALLSGGKEIAFSQTIEVSN